MIGYIYYILDLTNADMYIGSCKKEFWSHRKSKHKGQYNYCISNEIIKNNNYIFEILEENEFNSLEDLRKKEQLYINNNKCINKYKSFITNEERKKSHIEYNKNNRDYEKIYKERREKYKNDDEYRKKIQDKKKNKIKCDVCGTFITNGHIARHKKTKKCIQSRLVTPPCNL